MNSGTRRLGFSLSGWTCTNYFKYLFLIFSSISKIKDNENFFIVSLQIWGESILHSWTLFSRKWLPQMLIAMEATLSYEYYYLSMELIYSLGDVEENTKNKITFCYYLIYSGQPLFSTPYIHWAPWSVNQSYKLDTVFMGIFTRQKNQSALWYLYPWKVAQYNPICHVSFFFQMPFYTWNTAYRIILCHSPRE